MRNENFIYEINFSKWLFHFVCELDIFYRIYSTISYVKFWTSSFHMWIRYLTYKSDRILYVKMFQFYMFLTCEVTCEIFARVVHLDAFSLSPSCKEQFPKFEIKEIRAVWTIPSNHPANHPSISILLFFQNGISIYVSKEMVRHASVFFSFAKHLFFVFPINDVVVCPALKKSLSYDMLLNKRFCPIFRLAVVPQGHLN